MKMNNSNSGWNNSGWSNSGTGSDSGMERQRVRCGVNSCYYNTQDSCALDAIQISSSTGSEDSMSKDGTMCASFRAK